ncbi:MAG: RNA polymerase sigma factor, partial [Gemmataceae bacterium]
LAPGVGSAFMTLIRGSLPDAYTMMTDQSLLERVQAGEQDAATALYLRYADHLRNLAAKQTSATLASRVDAEDVVQSVFRTFFRRVAKDQYDVPRGDDLWKLFLVIALNKIRNLANHHLAAKRDARQTIGIIDETIPVANTADATNLHVLQMVVEDLLVELPQSSQAMVRMRIDGHEVNEIVETTGRSKRSVERVLQQFREQLKAILDESP